MLQFFDDGEEGETERDHPRKRGNSEKSEKGQQVAGKKKVRAGEAGFK